MMLTSRVALNNSTNSPCSGSISRPTSTRCLPKPTSRKSAPTCTVSLANAGANGSSTSLTSVTSSGTSHVNLIPFPSSSEFSDSSISQPDRTCLLLLRQSSDISLQPGTRASPILLSSQERRKRSTARLQSIPELKSGGEPLCQPPRKRPRLQKDLKQVKRTSYIDSSDLRFMAVVQRSVACTVLSRRGGRAESNGRSQRSSILEAQDVLLASRLRLHLLSHGFRDADLISTDVEFCTDSAMDVDAELHRPSVVSVDMDVDVETPENSDADLAQGSLPHQAGSLGLDRLSSCQLVATLIMRQHVHTPSRFSLKPGMLGSGRKTSPLVALNL